MHIIILLALLLLVIFGPGIWVQRVLSRYSTPADRYSGSGSELARHLLDSQGLSSVKVEETDKGDHYDPLEKAVRLSADNYSGSSLTAIVVAAHEVGHAMQDGSQYRPLNLRTSLAKSARGMEKIGAAVLILSPVIGAITRVPQVALLTFVGGFLALASSTVMHLVTLPVEIDASFRRALPLLDEQKILHERDRPHARKILKAAAYTYVAASLMSLLNVARWIMILRR